MTHYLTPEWTAPKNIRAFCTTREKGHSQHPYDSFNMATHVGDHETAVEKNRQQLIKDLSLPQTPQWLTQTHSTIALDFDYPQKNLEADACHTRTSNTVCAVLTADCLPILICNQQGTEVAAIHAGWRGLLHGVIEETINQLKSPKNQLMAWMGPAIGPENFEVGEEIIVDFLNSSPQNSACFEQRENGAIYADMFKIARLYLQRSGLEQITGGNCCTYSDNTRFYSYRRDGVTGRMASLIWIG